MSPIGTASWSAAAGGGGRDPAIFGYSRPGGYSGSAAKGRMESKRGLGPRSGAPLLCRLGEIYCPYLAKKNKITIRTQWGARLRGERICGHFLPFSDGKKRTIEEHEAGVPSS